MSQETLFLKNTETFAESMARCGVKYHFAYPITPATDVMKRTAVILPKYGGKMMQMESELAVSSALAGAACTGKLAATSSSGPGMSLMQEAISFMAGAELPCIMLDSMRVGPGDGDIDAARQNSPGECVITSDTSSCIRCKKIAKAGQVPAFLVSPVVVWGMAGLACAGA